MWTVFFAVLLGLIAYKFIKDPIWLAMGGAFVYYAIPHFEFGFPALPMQAGFFFFGTVFSLRYYDLFVREAKVEILDAAGFAHRRAIERVRQDVVASVIEQALERHPRENVVDRVVAEHRRAFGDELELHAPGAVTTTVKRSVEKSLRAALDASADEAYAIVGRNEGMALGLLKGMLNDRVMAEFRRKVSEKEAEILEKQVDDRFETESQDVEARRRDSDQGPLGIPLPIGPIVGVFSNTGFWVHLVFIVLTRIGVDRALYDSGMANEAYDVALKLLIPLIGIMASVRTVTHFRFFTYAWVGGVLYLSSKAVKYWLTMGGRAEYIGGQGNESNFLAAIVVMVAPIAFSLVLNLREKKRRMIALGTAGILTLAVLASGSRGGLLAFGAAMGFWGLFTNRKTLAGGVGVLALTCFLAVAPASFWVRMGTIVGEKTTNPWVQQRRDLSAAERIELWGLAMESFERYPVMGIGPRNYIVLSELESSITDAYAGKRGMQTHNAWLQIICEYGVVGFFVWAGGFFFSMWCFDRARRKLAGYPGYEWFPGICLGFEAGAVGTFVMYFFNSFQWYDYFYWYIVMGPIALQVAWRTAEKLNWMAPEGGIQEDHARSRRGGDRPPPRYGPPQQADLGVENIDLSTAMPLKPIE